MHLDGEGFGKLGRWISNEVDFPGLIGKGTKGGKVTRVQEWLNLHGVGLGIDGKFGKTTVRQVRLFQEKHHLPVKGEVDQATYAELVAPMRKVLSVPAKKPRSLTQAIVLFAKRHLAARPHPREMGGQNKGPWVRLYMTGGQGKKYLWCAGFATFLLKQAAEFLGCPMPIAGDTSCTTIATQAKRAGLFRDGSASNGDIMPGSFFLTRKNSKKWTHIGIVTKVDDGDFLTIEGNTNDDGDSEGYEVCARRRGYNNRDFVIF